MPFNTQPPYNISVVVDVTASRALNVDYTNNTGKTMFVHATVRCTTGAAPNLAIATILVDGQPKNNAGYETGSPTDMNTYFELVAPVPPGSRYMVGNGTSGTGNVELYSWVEAY